ncbi:MAG: GH25 family lysozyme [Candidatus Absconditabacteria bacterium]|nr:GH25 family lysozyme [Tissierellia bacterium]MDD4714717.1 GH25 family lysozyme [Candidatus Absconditabacteria bacterium]
MERKGLDISSYQRGINFDVVKSNVDFLILRAGFTGWGGDGTNKNKDSCFEDFYNQSKARGIPVGAYWYSCANTYDKGRAEAEYLYNNCLRGKQFEYPIYMDVEEDRHQQVGKTRIADAIKGFCEYLENKGYYVGIYANSNYFNNFIDTAKLSMYDKWLAVWTSNKPSFKYGDYGLWQNSSSGYISGMRVDTDYAYKDYPTIIKKAGLNGYSKGTPETPKVEPTKKSNDEIATEVINGNWGNGADRKNALTNAGYDYAVIQSIVNARLGVTSKPSAKYHTVVKGDTLWAIAKKYYGDGNKYPEIARANNIANPNIISVGQKLLIP